MLRLLKGLIFIGLLIFAIPAYALDCTSPDIKKDKILTAICAHPELKQADDAMNRAYLSLYKGRDKQQQQVIKTLQREWLSTERGQSCASDPVDVPCLVQSIHRRTDFLNGADGTGPVTQGKLVFKGHYEKRVKLSDVEVNISLFEFEKADSSEKEQFNKQVEALLPTSNENDPEGTPQVDGEEENDCSNCLIYTVMRQPFQSGTFISAPVDTWEYTGGAHGTGDTSYINSFFDEKGPFSFGDLLMAYDTPVLAKACFNEAVGDPGNTEFGDAVAGDNGDDNNPLRPSNAFMNLFSDPSRWKFDGKSIEVSFPVYSLGPYSAGVASCKLPYAALQQHLSGTRPLPEAVN